MTKHRVLVTDLITVIREAHVDIEADSEEAALERAEEMYRNGDLELRETDDYCEAHDASFEILEGPQ